MILLDFCMNEFLFNSPDEECSLLLGHRIGELLRAGDILALRGELASGKTLFTQGIARGLGIGPEVRVTSPTFTIINEYTGRLHLFHLDLYRISGPDESDPALAGISFRKRGGCHRMA